MNNLLFLPMTSFKGVRYSFLSIIYDRIINQNDNEVKISSYTEVTKGDLSLEEYRKEDNDVFINNLKLKQFLSENIPEKNEKIIKYGFIVFIGDYYLTLQPDCPTMIRFKNKEDAILCKLTYS